MRLRFSDVRICSSGTAALEAARQEHPSIIIVDSRLDDMDGCEFIRLLARDARNGGRPPAIMATLDRRRDHVLDAIAAGCSGYVLRPYSLRTMESHLALAQHVAGADEVEEELLASAWHHLSIGAFGEAALELEEIVATPDESLSHFAEGMRLLVAGRYGKAVVAFQRALRGNELLAEAHRGLGEAYRGQGDLNRSLKSLQRAAELFAQQDMLQEAKDIFIQILKTEPDSPNPYNTLGVRLRRSGDLSGALQAYFIAIELSPDDETLFYNIAKAYLFIGNQHLAEQYLRKALTMNPGFPEARTMFSRLTGDEWWYDPAVTPRMARPQHLLRDEG